MSLFTQTNLSPRDHILKFTLKFLGMTKLGDDIIEKKIKSEENL